MTRGIKVSNNLLVALITICGCSRTSSLDHNWASPVQITTSIDNLAGGVSLYKYFDGIVAIQSLQNTSENCFLLEHGANGYFLSSKISCSGLPTGYTFPPTADSTGHELLFFNAYTENENLALSALFTRIIDNSLSEQRENKWVVDKSQLFDNMGPDLMLDYHKEREPLGGLGIGILCDQNVLLPMSITSELVTHEGQNTIIKDGKSSTGVFHSTDGGASWQFERIADFEALGPLVCKSDGCYYFFGARIKDGYQFWCSRKSVSNALWDTPGVIAKSYATVYGDYAAAADKDVVHVCWMDRRHDKYRFNVGGPFIENDDIFYCHRRDSDNDWSKGVCLSSGLLYSYSPSMSIEGSNIVVAWAGIKSAGRDHVENDPNDIYYVISKDGGNTWTQPLMVTDGAKDGIVSGKPKVMLLNGIINLFYIQGEHENSTQPGSGLTRLNGQSWPIYYTQRHFPN